MIFPALTAAMSRACPQRAFPPRAAIVGLLALCGAIATDSYAANVTFQWDYSESDASQSEAAGFAVYCGNSPRSYLTRTDVHKSDLVTLSLAGGSVHYCAAVAYDASGAESAFSDEIAVSVRDDTGTVAVVAPIGVRSVFLTTTSIRTVFRTPFDRTRLNLYGSQQGAEGPADVTLVGLTSGPVRGSLVVGADNQRFTFVKTAGVLVPDTYTLTIASRLGRLLEVFGPPIKGDASALFGDDYRLAFQVAPVNTPLLSIGSFARGPDQTINLPAADETAGIPVRIFHGAGVQDVAFTLQYDPALLSIDDVTLPPSVSGDLTLKFIDALSGLLWVHVENLSGLTDASTVLVTLHAGVPLEAPYGSQHLLRLSAVKFNGGTQSGHDYDGLHVVAKLGNSSGTRKYSAVDALFIQRVIVRLDTGFSAYPLTDPVIVGDTNGSGQLDADDARLVQLKILRRPVPEIPD